MQQTNAKVRMGMVGGGPDAFIGNIHRIASRLDGEIELVCGAFSRDPEKSQQFGKSLHLAPERCYENYQRMIQAEAELSADKRMEFVAIVTPNNSHFAIASLAIAKGFHVMCDKPVTFDLQQAMQLKQQVENSGRLFGLTHTYTAYPLVQEARQRVLNGELGRITKIVAEYNQGWLAAKMKADQGKQAAWRLDPEQAGAGGCVGDIGVHAANLAEFISGLSIVEVLAELNTVEPGRHLDDDGAALLRFSNGCKGVLFASQIAVGEENNLRIRIYGSKGGLEWQQQEPNSLYLKWGDKPEQVLRTGNTYLGRAAQANTRTPSGHPEGYLEAFANLYKHFALAIKTGRGQSIAPGIKDVNYVPGVKEGVAGMAFIEAVVASSLQGGAWVKLQRN